MNAKDLLQSSGIELQPGLSAEELLALEQRLGLPLPPDMRELLAFARGFACERAGEVDFTGSLPFAFESAFPCGVPVAADGMGNFWVVDANPATGAWGPVFFASHDPPVMALQARDLAAFLAQVLAPGQSSALDQVREKAVFRIWREKPGLLTKDQALQSEDPELAAFAAQLDERFEICDLRGADVGQGFAWGRAGPRAEVRRHGAALIFAVQAGAKKGLLARLLARA